MSIQVLVTSDSPSAAGALAARMEAVGIRTVTAAGERAARHAVRAHAIDGVIVEVERSSAAAAHTLARSLREAAGPRRLAVAALVDPAFAPEIDLSAFDTVLTEPLSPTQAAARLQGLARLAVMDEEVRLRAQTLSMREESIPLNLTLHEPMDVRALYVGEPHRDFLAVQRALYEHGGDLAAAHTTFSAFDFLHDHPFDAVVLNAMSDYERAMTLCAAFRRNSRLHHVPILLLMDHDGLKHGEDAFSRGAADVILIDDGLDEMARKIINLARHRRRRGLLAAGFAALRTTDSSDPTGLATAHFFADHIRVMADGAQASNRALSVIVMRADAPGSVSPRSRDEGLRQLGGMVRHMVRVEDFCGRLSPGLFAVALPNCALSDAQKVAERLEAVSECTAFENEDNYDDPFTMRIRTACVEMHRGETGRSLLVRAISDFETQARAG